MRTISEGENLLEQEGRIWGIMALNEFQEPAYREVQWQFSGKALVVHRLAVDQLCQGKGLARELMRFASEFAGKHAYATHNPRAVALYERLGYRRAGTVQFRKGPFICYEIQVG